CTATSGSATGFAQPASATVPPGSTRAFWVRKPMSGPLILKRSSSAGAPKPTFQPSGRSPASSRALRSASCAVMPRATRGSSQRFIPGLSFTACRIDLVARILDRAGAHPAPRQHHVLVRRVVESVPAAARRVDHVALDRRLLPEIAVDVAAALDHDEELI